MVANKARTQTDEAIDEILADDEAVIHADNAEAGAEHTCCGGGHASGEDLEDADASHTCCGGKNSGGHAAAKADEPDWKDQAVRALAEMENLRKRQVKEVSDARQFAVSRFALEMLNVADNMARAQATLPEKAEGDVKTIKEGVAMVMHQFSQSLEKFGVKKFNSMGEMMDAEKHQVMQEIDSDKPAGTVVMEMQAGYMIGGRLLRPALVAVSKGGSN